MEFHPMLFKSQLIGPASGKMNGMVASHNRGGQYFRQLRIPTNPRSSFQQVVRDALKTLATRYVEVLTGDQRKAWQDYSNAVPLVNRLGDPRSIPAISMYVRCNVPRIQNSLPIVDDAPIINDLGTFTPPTATVVALGTTMSLAFDNTDDWANEDDSAMLVYTAAAQNASKLFFIGPYRLAGIIPGDGTTPPTSPATITLPSPIGPAGSNFFFKTSVSRADGRLATNFLGLVSVP
jgi:hypothetical protein